MIPGMRERAMTADGKMRPRKIVAKPGIALAPTTKIYDHGHWSKIDENLTMVDYRSLPPPTAEEVDEMLMEKQVAIGDRPCPRGEEVDR